ncbi:hypothetical protein [Goodfellowiella coeruleoviolacea]|uniref:Uncharacterized protein n=1 Tax=Goodfellowiella coeruleoviolacea TaxID=334858 RepID=A0AAE3GE71_9PSEU|nr:hypothetical protein [Goodfellowiella coeruleoviolacea]MCP2166637.1 hypothetical protein [Goodfellowiella coeruleoviolacea]
MSSEQADAGKSDRISLDLLDLAAVRRRARSVAIGGLMVAAAFGGIAGLIGGRVAGLVTAVVVGLPLELLAWSESRRRTWLRGTQVSARAFGTRTVDLHRLDQLDLLVSDLRGQRTVGLFVAGGGKAINLPLAIYAGTGGRELGVFPLRRLADSLAGSGDTRGLVFAELLVAQLRAEARGAAVGERPLYKLGSLAPGGRLAQKLRPDAVSRFVATLD